MDEQQNKHIEPRICRNCHKPFTSDIKVQKYCSYSCKQQYKHKRKKAIDKTDIRAHKVRLEETYIKANGICWICGVKCSFNDVQYKDGKKILGPTYPTRDHVVPRSEGGVTNKDNILLCCHQCNNKKASSFSDTDISKASEFKTEAKNIRLGKMLPPPEHLEYPDISDIDLT